VIQNKTEIRSVYFVLICEVELTMIANRLFNNDANTICACCFGFAAGRIRTTRATRSTVSAARRLHLQAATVAWVVFSAKKTGDSSPNESPGDQPNQHNL
jgi:hypothetical protein